MTEMLFSDCVQFNWKHRGRGKFVQGEWGRVGYKVTHTINIVLITDYIIDYYDHYYYVNYMKRIVRGW